MTVFLKAARVVGDLDDAFYNDERQRDVWNEASAVGFQLFQWIALAVGALLPWIAGRVGAQIAIGVLGVWFLISIATIAYARAYDVDVYATVMRVRPRIVVAGVLYLVGVAGIYVQLAPPAEYDTGTGAGTIVGAIVGGGVAAAVLGWFRRRDRRREAEAAARDESDI